MFTFLLTRERSSKRHNLPYHFRTWFFKGQLRFYYGVSHKGGGGVGFEESGELDP